MRWTPDRIGDLAGTTALVTGANSGIGLSRRSSWPGTVPRLLAGATATSVTPRPQRIRAPPA